MTNSPEDFDLLKSAFQTMNLQKKKFFEETIFLAKKESIPWSEGIIIRLSQLNIDDADVVLENHPGHPLFSIWESIDNLLKVFELNFRGLSNSLDEFSIKVESPDFFSRRRKAEFDELCSQINRGMYNFTSVAVALREVTRRLKGKFSPGNYIERFDQCYANSNVFNFINNLRKALHHLHFAKAYYHVKNDPIAPKSEFYLSSTELLSLKFFNTKSKEVISESGNQVFVRPIFIHHRENVLLFYEWVSSQINLAPSFIDFKKSQLVPIQNAARFWHEFIILKMEEGNKSPYDYLDESFTDEELEQIRKLPHGSKQQIDKMIKLYDEHNSLTDELIERVYKIFGAM